MRIQVSQQNYRKSVNNNLDITLGHNQVNKYQYQIQVQATKHISLLPNEDTSRLPNTLKSNANTFPP